MPFLWATFEIFSARSKWFPVRREWWPWMKPGYFTMTRIQSNNQWSGGIATHPAPKNSKCKNSLEKFSLRFFGIKRASFSLIIFQRAKLSTRSITYLCCCNWRTFCRKKAAGRSSRWSCSCTKMPRLTGHLPPEETGLPRLPVSWSPTLLSGSGPGPVGLPPVPWTKKKKIVRSPFFFRRGGHCCRGDLVGRTTFWISFWVACKSQSNGLRSVLIFVGSTRGI